MKGNVSQNMLLIIKNANMMYPEIPFFYFTDKDKAGLMNIYTLAAGRLHSQGRFSILKLPSVNYIPFISKKKQRNTLHDMNALLSHINNLRNTNTPRSIYMADAFEELYHSKAKYSLVTADSAQVNQQMYGAIQRAHALNVDLTADSTQLAAYQNKVMMMDEFEVEWFVKKQTIEECWYTGGMPHKVLNYIGFLAKKEYELDFVTIQLMTTSMVPEFKNLNEYDFQFIQSNSATYFVMEYNPNTKIVKIYAPNTRVSINQGEAKKIVAKKEAKKKAKEEERAQINEAYGFNDSDDENEFDENYSSDDDDLLEMGDKAKPNKKTWNAKLNNMVFDEDISEADVICYLKDKNAKKLERQISQVKNQVSCYLLVRFKTDEELTS